MIVRDEDHVNRRQIGKGEARIAYPSRPQMSERARTIGIDGVREDVESRKLNEESNVVDEGQCNPALLKTRR